MGDQKHVVEAENGKTVLQIGLDADLPIEHACGGNGFCTTCMCEIEEGKANVSELNDREENMGITGEPERLGCQTEIRGDVTVRIVGA